MQKNIYTKIMIIKKMKIKLSLAVSLIVASCAAPGMYMNNNDSVYISGIDKEIKIESIKNYREVSASSRSLYRIGNGDQISITVWGLPEIFPISNINPDQNLRRVDSNGNIYFPYVGVIKAAGKTQNELRESLSDNLALYFTEPQLDISIARFNSQKIYLLGEVTNPSKINITDIPLSLSEALGEVKGLNTNTSASGQVFIIRQGANGTDPKIIRADLSSPANFIAAGEFYMADNDIIYVNASGTTRWNRIISQFFPFSSFLNSIDNLTSN